MLISISRNELGAIKYALSALEAMATEAEKAEERRRKKPEKLPSQDFTPRTPEYRMERFAELRAQHPDFTYEEMMEALHDAEIDDQCDI